MNATVVLAPNYVADFCRRWKIAELAVFGSTLRDDFSGQNDVDLLATFAPEADWSLLDHVQMKQELEKVIGRPVDLISRRAMERSSNFVRRNHILTSARTIHVAR